MAAGLLALPFGTAHAAETPVHDTSQAALAQSQLRDVTGRVTDRATGDPIVGVTVANNSTGSGTVTDAAGAFTVKAATGQLLTISCVGYTSWTVKVPASGAIDVELSEDAQQLDDVVVVGYATQKKINVTGAVSSISGEELAQRPVVSTMQALQGIDPSLNISIDSGNPTAGNSLNIRGVPSINGGSPLILVDGVPGVSLRLVNAADIESISVLKDASATSFYGSKAANGVVVITTRPTQAGRLQVNYSGNFQISIPDLSDYRLLNAREKLEYERQAGVYGDFTGSSSTDVTNQKSYYEKLDRVNAGVNTDWKRMALRTGFNHIHNLMLSGGSQDFRYNVSGSYNSTTGVMDESDKQTASLRINLTYGDMNKLFFQNIASLTQSNSNDVPYGSFSDYVSLNPYDRPYNDDGSLNSVLSFNTANPLYEKSLSSYIRNTSGSFIDTFRVRWNILKGLRVEASLSYTQTKSEGETFYSPLSQQFNNTIDANKKGSFDVSNGTTHNLSGNAFAVYNKAWNRRGGDASDLLSLTAGFNIESTRSESHSFSALGILSDKLEHPSMATGYAESRPGGSEDRSRMLGFYVNANYIWHNRYFVDLSFRYEGSSKFGADNKYAPFGSLGLGWNLHKERFLKGSAVSLLKLRMSMGYVGNAGFSPYQAQLAYQYSSSLQYNGGIGAVPVSMVNPRLKWERSLKRNLGLDFGLWRDRLNGSVDVYYDTTNDLVMDISKPAHIGFTSAKENLGKIRNSGIELSLRGNVLQRKHTNLNLFLNLSHNRNRIVEISDYLKNKNAENEANATSSLPAAFYEEGESMTALKVMRSAGINPANGKEVFIDRDGNPTYEYDYRDKYVAGDTTPAVQGSFGLSMSWRSFDLSMNFAYRLGASIYNQTLATKVEGASPTSNADRRVFYDRWKAPGDKARYKNIANRETTPPTDRFVATEYALEGSSLKLSYMLPDAFCRRLHLRRVRISASTGDLFNISTIRRERGLDYPFARVFQASLTVNL